MDALTTRTHRADPAVHVVIEPTEAPSFRKRRWAVAIIRVLEPEGHEVIVGFATGRERDLAERTASEIVAALNDAIAL